MAIKMAVKTAGNNRSRVSAETPKLAAALCVAVVLAGAAQAQNTTSRDAETNKQQSGTRTPHYNNSNNNTTGNRGNRPGLFVPGAMPHGNIGPIPINVGAIPVYGPQFRPNNIPLNTPNTTTYPGQVIYPGGGGYYHYPPQYPPTSQTTIIINNNSPYGSTTTYSASPGYNVAPVQTTITVFNGYSSVFTSGQTVYSPYGSLYGCRPYISTRYIVTEAYPWINGRDVERVSPWSDNDPYMAQNATRAQGLRAALNNLTRYWENEDIRGLRQHTSPDLSVAVFQGEKFSYSLKARDFVALSADALDQVNTTSFRFFDVRERSDGMVNAYATHRYRVRGTSESKTATVRCTLVYVDGGWFLNAVSFSPGSFKG